MQIVSTSIPPLALQVYGLEVENTEDAFSRCVPFSAVSFHEFTDKQSISRLRDAARRLQRGDITALRELRGLICYVQIGGQSRCARITGARAHLSDRQIYALCMSMPYEIVHTHQVFHIMRVWHRTYMKAIIMETMCETLGSDLRFMERKNSVGRDLSVGSLVKGTLLRAAGFRGDLTDGVGIFKALCRHFKTDGDACQFHFVRRSRRATGAGRLLLDEKYILGPSCTLSRERARAFDASRKRPSWLSTPDHGRELSKVVREPAVYGVRPELFPDEVWQQVQSIMRMAEVK